MFFIIEQFKKLLTVFEKRWTFFIPLVILFLFVTFLELLSLGLLIPYIKFVLDPGIILQLDLEKIIPFNINLKLENNENLFFIFSTLFLLVFIIRTLFILLVRYLIAKYSYGNLYELQINLMSSYQKLDFFEFNKRNRSEYLRNIRELSNGCMRCLESNLKLISESIVVFAIIVFLFFLEPIPLIIITLVMSLSLLIYNNFFIPKTIKYGEEKVKATKIIYQGVEESLKGLKEIQILGKQRFFEFLLQRGLYKVYINDLKSTVILMSPRYILELIIIIFIITYLSSQILLGIDRSAVLPIAGVFGLAGLRILPSVVIIANSILVIGNNTEPLNIIYEDFKNLKKNKEMQIKKGEELLIENFKSLELKNIKFKYPNSSKLVFANLNFTLTKNQIVGLTGDTGSGKSTLVDIILGFIKPDSGTICVNNKESDLKSALPNNIYYLPQDHLIINDTIEKNITLSNEEMKDFKKISYAIKQANFDKFMNDLPQSIKTIIGQGGINLSGGQYKKICLARLFCHEKEILIMDEATNALDKASENLIIEEIKHLKEKKTIILISHNPNTLKYCDKIYKVKDKQIIDITNQNP